MLGPAVRKRMEVRMRRMSMKLKKSEIKR